MAHTRYRIIIANVGATLTEGAFTGLPATGKIFRVKATADVAEDADATVGGTGGVDIRMEVREASGATGLGGMPGSSVAGSQGLIARYDLTPLDPDLTIDSEEDLTYYALAVSGASTGTLSVAVALDAEGAGNASVVVTLDIEEAPNG